MLIESKQNDKIKKIASLKEKKHRKENGAFLIEGVKMVREAVVANADIFTIIGLENLVCEFQKMSLACEIIETTTAVMDYICDAETPQGIAAVLKIPDATKVSVQKRSLVLDGVSDPGNVGTIIRTAACVGIKQLFLIDCADAYSPKTVRSSMSGFLHTEIITITRNDFLKLDIQPIIAADMGGEDVFNFTAPESFCLALGSEAHGVSDEIAAAARYTVSIPMTAEMESLNVGVAAGILMYLLSSR